jgi:hypothetical protein
MNLLYPSYSSDPQWLNRAYEILAAIYEIKQGLLQPGSLNRLSLSLVRVGVPVRASTVLCIMLEAGTLPSVDILCIFFLHIGQNSSGTCTLRQFVCRDLQLLHETGFLKKEAPKD